MELVKARATLQIWGSIGSSETTGETMKANVL